MKVSLESVAESDSLGEEEGSGDRTISGGTFIKVDVDLDSLPLADSHKGYEVVTVFGLSDFDN